MKTYHQLSQQAAAVLGKTFREIAKSSDLAPVLRGYYISLSFSGSVAVIVTASVAADILGVNVETLRSWIKRRIYEIPERQGGWVRYGLDDLTALATIVALNKIGIQVDVAAAMTRRIEYQRAIQLADEELNVHDDERGNVSLVVNYHNESSEFEAQVCDSSATIGAVVDTDAAAVVNISKIRHRIRKCYSEQELAYGLTRTLQAACLPSSSLLSAPKVKRKRR